MRAHLILDGNLHVEYLLIRCRFSRGTHNMHTHRKCEKQKLKMYNGKKARYFVTLRQATVNAHTEICVLFSQRACERKRREQNETQKSATHHPI